ncbi:FliM/FliN family flagellar motor switch protein [Croceicoccus sp. F390]|uniref:Flagellar motor switch protein FliN n=1 Tax=Croceicoccus esteveae TaxID=3075597 RepID=A0ABU2ZF10_9SPHN|nr:FliM/FliN family flagellar motor switch protein [Croceicoccus sp. F390]MDT0574683.1 FliM/FliN family flagellar motor switch protein [Croceicoccus sp. F390]
MTKIAENRRGLDLLRNVDVCLSVELGRTSMKLKEVLALGEDSIVPLDRLTDELLDVYVNGRAVAKGEIINEGKRFSLRIVELADEDDHEPRGPHEGQEERAQDAA